MFHGLKNIESVRANDRQIITKEFYYRGKTKKQQACPSFRREQFRFVFRNGQKIIFLRYSMEDRKEKKIDDFLEKLVEFARYNELKRSLQGI